MLEWKENVEWRRKQDSDHNHLIFMYRWHNLFIPHLHVFDVIEANRSYERLASLKKITSLI